MSKSNVAEKRPAVQTHEGASAMRINAEQQLRRSVMACLLWEGEFYESGEQIAARIGALVRSLPFETVADIALEAREKMKLRHVPLLLTVELLKAKHQGRQVGDLIARVCQRADEPGELLSLYWQGQKDAPLTKQMKLGLARALRKFDEYQLAKYNSDEAAVKLRDVLFLSHAKPLDASPRVKFTKVQRKKAGDYTLNKHEAVFKRLAENTLKTPHTWEVQLSAGADKKETFERLMSEEQLGALAFLRNLRNMEQAGVSVKKIAAYGMTVDLSRVLPFRFIAAANAVPTMEHVIEPMMFRALEGQAKFKGRTGLLIDGSASMNSPVSEKSDITRRDAACALAILMRELCDDVAIYGFSTQPWDIPARRGFALRDAVRAKIDPQATYLGRAVRYAQRHGDLDRIIVITDEQSADKPEAPKGAGYVINVASAQNGIGYGPWTNIDGWSVAVIDYIRENERK